jgi:hypothetical protein
MRQTACARRFLPAMIGGGTWEGAHARHEATGVCQPVRRRSGYVAIGGARAAGDKVRRRQVVTADKLFSEQSSAKPN